VPVGIRVVCHGTLRAYPRTVDENVDSARSSGGEDDGGACCGVGGHVGNETEKRFT
jgi:hypothetical protein